MGNPPPLPLKMTLLPMLSPFVSLSSSLQSSIHHVLFSIPFSSPSFITSSLRLVAQLYCKNIKNDFNLDEE
ncbi:hypothetical protein PVL29_003594 [Vitis rotundifolia]|uniref:Uncharacterized protein n=1 Tax=Vitis rotundifolia TaxID=103349 RepID=A0AA39ADH3_VITRO|nr:hypothetical protein PVL29_003594 [Vitis rotundifolia]